MGKVIKPTDPPLVDLKVTNPITYIKRWWTKIIGNEGIDFRFHIRPLTALAISAIIATIAFGVGRFVFPFEIPFFKFEETKPYSSSLPTSSPDPWKDTGFTGTLQYTPSTNRYFLVVTSSSEAITLEVPPTIDLKELVGKRIFATGKYNKSTRILIVSDTKSLEVLPKTPVPVPTIEPTPIPTQTPTPTDIPSQ